MTRQDFQFGALVNLGIALLFAVLLGGFTWLPNACVAAVCTLMAEFDPK